MEKPPEDDFFSLYLEYTNQTECPTLFHRWTAISCLAAFLARDVHFKFGHTILYPNLYVMFIGSPGSRKTSAINIGAKLLKLQGYTNFAAKKTRQEKFLIDLAESQQDPGEACDILDETIFTSGYEHLAPAESFITADEFNNFIGAGNLDFLSLLGELWDYEGVYDHKLKNSKDVHINEPCINILSGNTPVGLSQFPPDVIGQGFFSRLILVYGQPTGVKYTVPPSPDLDKQMQLIEFLHNIKKEIKGEVKLTDEGMKLLDEIYHKWQSLEDPRFEHYSSRRLTHLLKISLVVAVGHLSPQIDREHIVYANTVLTLTEHIMPKALGEFGTSRNSAVTHKVMQVLDNTYEPMNLQAIWKAVHADLEKRDQLVDILGNLSIADKIQTCEGGFLPKKKVRVDGIKGAVNWKYVTESELNLI